MEFDQMTEKQIEEVLQEYRDTVAAAVADLIEKLGTKADLRAAAVAHLAQAIGLETFLIAGGEGEAPVTGVFGPEDDVVGIAEILVRAAADADDVAGETLH
jgi:hypothetical protein